MKGKRRAVAEPESVAQAKTGTEVRPVVEGESEGKDVTDADEAAEGEALVDVEMSRSQMLAIAQRHRVS